VAEALSLFGGTGAAAVHPRDVQWVRAQLVDIQSSLPSRSVSSQEWVSSDGCHPRRV